MTVIFGGAFNPPHLSHIALANVIAQRTDVDKILVIPTFLSVHKRAAETDFADRLNMCRIAFKNIEKVTVSDIEQTLSNKSYTYNTILALKEQGESNLALLIGADMAESFDEWYNYQEIIKLCKIFVFKRNGSLDTTVLEKANANFEVIDFNAKGFSSSDFRDNKNEAALSEDVLDYIKSHSLYGYDEIYKQELQKNLKEKRYNHCLNVAQSAKELARIYGADEQKAYTAGLLHDITKELDAQTQLKLCDEFGIIMSSLEKNAFKLWHAMTGAYYVKNVLKINDDEIFDAIYYHTTAKENMSLLTKIIYIADYISDDRDYNGVEEMRMASKQGLDKAISIATEFTVNDLKEQNRAIHPNTIKAYNQYFLKRDLKMDEKFNFSEMQQTRRSKKKKKQIRKIVNIVASIVLSICILLTGIMASYIFGIGEIQIGHDDTESGDFEDLLTSKHSGVSYILIAGLCPPEEGGLLTDTIIVACIDHNRDTLNFLQIPRDLYIGTEDGSVYSGGKINAVYAQPRNGENRINALRRVINGYLGIPLDHYVLFNIPAFINLIDALGGLEITIQHENGATLRDYHTKEDITVGPGKVNLKGSLAIGYMRKRYGVSQGYLMGDADRVKAQQLVYIALAKKLKSMSTSQMINIASSCYKEIETDISLNNILGYAAEVKKMKMENMGVYGFPGQYSQYNKSSVYCVHKDEYIELYNEHFNPYGDELKESDIYIYEWYKEMGQPYEPPTIGGGTLAQLAEDKNQK